MLPESVYKILNHPFVYQLAQHILGPGAQSRLLRQMGKVMAEYPAGKKILDVGCGPRSWLWHFGLHPVGLDLQQSYIDNYKAAGEEGVVGSADDLPFADESFDSVWSIGLFHHVPDDATRKALAEAIRVCRKEGNVVIFDAVMPKCVWCRPLAVLIRRMDRGQFVRTEEQFLAVLPDAKWKISRFTHTYTGLELLQLIYHKD